MEEKKKHFFFLWFYNDTLQNNNMEFDLYDRNVNIILCFYILKYSAEWKIPNKSVERTTILYRRVHRIL